MNKQSAEYHRQYRAKKKLEASQGVTMKILDQKLDVLHQATVPKPEVKKLSKEESRCIHENAGSNGKCNQQGIERQASGHTLILCFAHRYCYGGSFPVHGETQSPYEGVPVVYPKA